MRLTLFVAVFLFAGHSLVAGSPPRVGLALSGGGAKGLAHVGVLKVLEEAGIHVDVVTGTSMGGVVGGLYSLGYSAAQIESLVVRTDWDRLLLDPSERRYLNMEQKPFDSRYAVTLGLDSAGLHLPRGVIEGQNIGVLLSELTSSAHEITDFKSLPRPFACVATDITNGDAVVLKKGDLGLAMRASMSIPTVFTPVEIDGRLLVDGGLVRNFPVEDARALGADIVIGVDIGAPTLKKEQIKDFVQVMMQATQFADAAALAKQRALCDVLILPDIEGLTLLGFDDTPGIIKRGEDAARALLPALKAVAARQGRGNEAQLHLHRSDSVLIHGIRLDGPEQAQRVFAGLDLRFPSRMSATDLSDMMEKLYSSRRLTRAEYRLHSDGPDTILTVRIVAKHDAEARLGVRYDSYAQASLLFNATLWQVGGSEGFASADFRLGRYNMFDARYAVPLGILPGLDFRAQLIAQEFPLSITQDGNLLLSIRGRSFFLSGVLGSLFERHVAASAGVRAEYAELNPEVSLFQFKEVARVLTASGEARFDTYDRTVYPRKGVALAGHLDAGVSGGSNEGDFLRGDLNVHGVIPLSHSFSLLAGGFLGGTSLGPLPSHYLFRLGGVNVVPAYPYAESSSMTLLGYPEMEFIGRQAQAVYMGLRAELLDGFFLIAQMSAGNVFATDPLQFSGRYYHSGYGFTGAYLTPLGPVELTFMKAPDRKFITYLRMGFTF
jgi:NTE family protein